MEGNGQKLDEDRDGDQPAGEAGPIDLWKQTAEANIVAMWERIGRIEDDRQRAKCIARLVLGVGLALLASTLVNKLTDALVPDDLE